MSIQIQRDPSKTKGHEVDIDSRIQQEDLARIKPLLAQGLTEKEIGVRLGIRADTISRKLSAFKNSKEFQSFLFESFFVLYPEMYRDHKVETFRTVSRLIGQAMASNPAVVEEFTRYEISWGGSKAVTDKDTEGVNCAAMIVAETSRTCESNRKSQDFGTDIVAEKVLPACQQNSTTSDKPAQLSTQKVEEKQSVPSNGQE